jgi:hypothetical protein
VGSIPLSSEEEKTNNSKCYFIGKMWPIADKEKINKLICNSKEEKDKFNRLPS